MKKNLFILIIFMSASLSMLGQNYYFPLTMDNLLELKWTVKSQEYSSNPTEHKGLVFGTFGLEYAWKAETGKKLYFNNPEHQQIIRSLSPDSLVFFSSREGIAVVNIYDGRILYKSLKRIKKPWIKKPRIIKGGTLETATNDSTFTSLDLLNNDIIWQKSFKTEVFNMPILDQQILYLMDEQFLYALDKNTGKEFWKHELGQLISEPYLAGNVFYGWIKDKGLVAFDINKKKILWAFEQNHKRSFYELVIEENTIFFYSSSLFALSMLNGEVIWKNNNLLSNESYILGSTKNYLLAYKSLDDTIVLTACDKKSGKIKYESFRGYDLKERPLSYLEHVTFWFADTMHENLIFAIDVSDNIYCFEVKE